MDQMSLSEFSGRSFYFPNSAKKYKYQKYKYEKAVKDKTEIVEHDRSCLKL